jgi:hypothetical protein
VGIAARTGGGNFVGIAAKIGGGNFVGIAPTDADAKMQEVTIDKVINLSFFMLNAPNNEDCVQIYFCIK